MGKNLERFPKIYAFLKVPSGKGVKKVKKFWRYIWEIFGRILEK